MIRNNIRRGGWRPWAWSTRTWVIAIALSVMASPLVTRLICLWQVPDVVLPFDVEEGIGDDDDLPEDQNALAVYQNVMKMLANPAGNPVNEDSEARTSTAEILLDDLIQRIFAHDEKALAEFVRAGAIKRTGGLSQKAYTFWTDLNFYQQLRPLVRTYNALAVSFEESGEIEKAWTVHHANLQCSLHAEQTHLAICGLIAYGLRTLSSEGIVQWASNPSVTAAQLRAARADISQVSASRLPNSVFSKGEYLAVRNTLGQLNAVDVFLPTGPEGQTSPTWLLIGKRIVIWCFAQPELTLRTNRQILVNNVIEQDKPSHLRRRSIAPSGLLIFELASDVRRLPGQLPAEQLARILESDSPALRINRTILPWMSNFDQARRRDSARLAGLLVLFAAHEFQRSQGEFPETLEQLVPSYLAEVPLDPLEEKGGSLQYRRDADGTAVVWSVGGNGVDDQGSVHSKDPLDIGFQIKLRRSDD